MNLDYTHHYRAWHDESPQHRADMVHHHSLLLGPHLPGDKDVPILDVGCGMGFTMLALKKLGYSSVAGVDTDPGQVAAAQGFGLDVTLSEDTISLLREQPARYGLIVCLDVIEHIPVVSQVDFVRALSTALQPDGQLICTVPNANAALASRWRYIDWTHTSSFTEHGLDFLLHNGGFRDIRIFPGEIRGRPKYPWLPVSGTRNWWLLKIMRGLRRLEMIAEFGSAVGRKIPLSLNLLTIARKR